MYPHSFYHSRLRGLDPSAGDAGRGLMECPHIHRLRSLPCLALPPCCLGILFSLYGISVPRGGQGTWRPEG